MVSEWQALPISEAPLDIVDGDRGTNYPKQEDFSASGDCLFLNTGNVTTSGFSFDECSFITKEKDAVLRKGKLQRYDVVLTTRGTVGNVAFFDDSVRYDHVRINSGMVLLRADQSKLLPRFLYQFVRSPLFREQVAGLATGSAQPQLPIRDIRRIELPLPPLPEQKRIAHILGTLDDKIELNQRMNATLEGMARALFQSWFVDFDPVRAKQQGRMPAGMDAATAKLFPAEFEESELGEIPKGWEVKSLDSALILQRGFDLPATARTEGEYPVIAASGPSGTHNAYQVRGPGVTTGRSGVLGRVFFVHEDFWPLNTSLWVKEYKAVSPCYAYQLLLTIDLKGLNAGSAVPTLNRNHVHSVQILIPPQPVVEAFDAVVLPLMKMQKCCTDESRILTAVRDLLLPKLLSGELTSVHNEVMK